MINNGYMSQSVFDKLNELFIKLKTRIDNDSNYIQLNNIELAKLGGNTSEFLPLNSRIVDFSLNNKHFEQIVEMLEDMKKIAKAQSETINNQMVEYELLKLRNEKTAQEKITFPVEKNTKGELSTEGIFDNSSQKPEKIDGGQNLSDGINKIF